MPFVSTSQDSSPTGICSRLPEVDLWEPYDGRLSRTVLREPGGEIPPGYSPDPPFAGRCPGRVGDLSGVGADVHPVVGQRVDAVVRGGVFGRVGRAARCLLSERVLFRAASLRTGLDRFRSSGSPVTTT